jgi:hypothetical protein
MTLTEFIDEKIAIALNYRGLSRFNPVEILIEGNGKQFVVLVSLLEPDTLTVPYNVTWINANPEHEDYKVLMRRVDAEKYDDKDYRGSWSVLSSVDEIFEEVQYFKKESDPILGEIQNFLPGLASVNRYGGFETSHDAVAVPGDRIVVGTNDTRMANARDPRPHTHADIPRTMISAGDGSDKFVSIIGSDPKNGELLFITGVDQVGNFIAEWLPPTTEFEYVGPLPTGLAVVGPTEHVPGASNHVLRADVTMDDGSKFFSVKAVWTLQDNLDHAEIGTNNGVFKAGLVAVDTPVTVRATWTHPDSGTVIYQDYVITIIGDPTLVILDHIEILGPTQFLKSETGTYTVRAHFTDGSTNIVTPNAFVSSNTNAGSFTAGVLTPKSNQVRDVATNLTATYATGGVTRQATIAVTIKDPLVYPNSIAITGPVSVDQDDSIDLNAAVSFSDATNGDVAGVWSVTASTYATIDQNGLLTAKPLTVPGSKTVEVNVSYTQNGVTVTAKKTIAIADTKNWPVSAAISGVSSLAPLGKAIFVYTVTYADGSDVVKAPTTWSTSDVTKATIDAAGEATGVANGNVSIRANYTEDGIVLNATKAIVIETVSVAIPPLRYGVAMFSNIQFTGGPIAGEITQEERDYGVTEETSASGRQYTHWTGFTDFVADVMTNTLDVAMDGIAKNFSTTISVDDYVYVMWDARAGDTFIVDLANSFNVTFDGINYRNDVIGNEEGLPGYDANLPKTLTVQFDDGTGVRPWIVVRSEATTLPEFSPRTDNYSIKYV